MKAKPDISASVSDGDYERLANFLSRVVGGKIQNLEALDGFLTALVISPELVPPSEYVPLITSGATEDDDLVFENSEEAETFFNILMRYWNQINRTFRSGEIYMPYLLEDDDGNASANDWATGFFRGTQLRYDAWTNVINDEATGGLFVPIFVLVYEHSTDPKLRPFEEPISREKREELLAFMIGGVRGLYEIFHGDRESSNPSKPTDTRPRQKVGRNDPCPCGSGEKFKKCCGQLTFH
jgi:uncharacterized protein